MKPDPNVPLLTRVPEKPADKAEVSAARDRLGSQTPEQLEAEIAQTRARIALGVDALSYKLSPEGLEQQAKATLRGTQTFSTRALGDLGDRLIGRSSGWSGGAAQFVKRNAAVATVVGAGLAWLLLRSSERRKET